MSKTKTANRRCLKRVVRRHDWIRGPDMMPKPVKKALREWQELYEPMEKIGFILHAFDPTIQFRCPDSNRVFDLPICAVKRINAALSPNESSSATRKRDDGQTKDL
jgi:hypothetical protein